MPEQLERERDRPTAEWVREAQERAQRSRDRRAEPRPTPWVQRVLAVVGLACVVLVLAALIVGFMPLR